MAVGRRSRWRSPRARIPATQMRPTGGPSRWWRRCPRLRGTSGVAATRHRRRRFRRGGSVAVGRCRAQVVVDAIYRPPGGLTARLRDAVRGQFEMALAVGKPVYVLGDFNVNLLSDDSPDSVHFNSLLRDLNMSQLITEPTHPHPVPSLLDLAITNVSSPDTRVSVLPHLIADHFPIAVRPSAPRLRRPPVTISSRAWHRVDWQVFSTDILHADWGPFYVAADVNEKLAIFIRIWNSNWDVADVADF